VLRLTDREEEAIASVTEAAEVARAKGYVAAERKAAVALEALTGKAAGHV
jgi:hypothetical protein